MFTHRKDKSTLTRRLLSTTDSSPDEFDRLKLAERDLRRPIRGKWVTCVFWNGVFIFCFY